MVNGFVQFFYILTGFLLTWSINWPINYWGKSFEVADFPFSSIIFNFIYFEDILLEAYTCYNVYRFLYLLGELSYHYAINSPSLPLEIFLAQESMFYDVNTVISVFFSLVFIWYTAFILLLSTYIILNIILYLKWVSYRKHIVGGHLKNLFR